MNYTAFCDPSSECYELQCFFCPRLRNLMNYNAFHHHRHDHHHRHHHHRRRHQALKFTVQASGLKYVTKASSWPSSSSSSETSDFEVYCSSIGVWNKWPNHHHDHHNCHHPLHYHHHRQRHQIVKFTVQAYGVWNFVVLTSETLSYVLDCGSVIPS